MSEQAFNESIGKSLTGFDGVWQRVTATAGGVSDKATLRQLIQDTWQMAQQYTSLARQFSGPGRSTLTGHAARCAVQARRLRAEYFIHTGQTVVPDGSTPAEKTGPLAGLRDLMLQEQALFQHYQKAARETNWEDTASLYQDFASQARSRAQVDKDLLIDRF